MGSPAGTGWRALTALLKRLLSPIIAPRTDCQAHHRASWSHTFFPSAYPAPSSVHSPHEAAPHPHPQKSPLPQAPRPHASAPPENAPAPTKRPDLPLPSPPVSVTLILTRLPNSVPAQIPPPHPSAPFPPPVALLLPPPPPQYYPHAHQAKPPRLPAPPALAHPPAPPIRPATTRASVSRSSPRSTLTNSTPYSGFAGNFPSRVASTPARSSGLNVIA